MSFAILIINFISQLFLHKDQSICVFIFEDAKELWKEDKYFRFNVIANAIIWPLAFGQLFFDVVSNSIIHFLT